MATLTTVIVLYNAYMDLLKKNLYLLAIALLLLPYAFVHAQKPKSCSEILKSQKKISKAEGFAQLEAGWPIFYRHFKVPRAKGTLVIANGLVFELSNYDDFIKQMNAQGYNVLVYAHRSQHESLEKAIELGLKARYYSTDDLAEDLNELLDILKIKKNIHIAGLSFGASVAAQFAYSYPEKVKSLNLLAPLIYLDATYTMIVESRMNLCAFNPLACLFMTNDPDYDHLTLSAKNYNLMNYEFSVPVNLFQAGEEAGELRAQQDKYIDEVLIPSGGQHILMDKASHSLVVSQPDQLAKHLEKLLKVSQ